MTQKKLLIIGIDGVGADIIEKLVSNGKLNNIKSILNKSTWGPLHSTLPPTTLPAWTNFMTGTEPSTHGVSDFTVKDGYQVKFIGADQRQVPTFFKHLSAQGLKVASAWFPATYPPEKLSGYQISGWDSPVTTQGDASFVHPMGLHDRLKQQFRNDIFNFDSLDEFSTDKNWYPTAVKKLIKNINNKKNMALWLLKNRPCDVNAFYFGETDTVAHHFWPFYDPSSPRRPQTFDPTLKNALQDVYTAVDAAIGEMIETAGNNTSIIMLSDHGSGGASHVAIHLNSVLEQAGLLKYKSKKSMGFENKTSTPKTFVALDKKKALNRGDAINQIPRALRRPLFKFAGNFAPSLLESHLRFSGIDWQNTLAFSEEITYAPAIWFNLKGREPNGQLLLSDREKTTRQIVDVLLNITDAKGNTLVKKVHKRADLHKGRHLHRFPDLVLELAEIEGHTPVCLPTRTSGTQSVSYLSGPELLGRKGRTLPGCHTRFGFFAVSDPDVAAQKVTGTSLQDMAPLIYHLLGVQKPHWFEGSCPQIQTNPILNPHDNKKESSQNRIDQNKTVHIESTPTKAYSAAEQKIVADRLKRLGYLEE